MDGMEVIAILVVIGLFVVVLKQFGIWEPLSLEGKKASLKKFNRDVSVLKPCAAWH